jgi:hypothetical protein
MILITDIKRNVDRICFSEYQSNFHPFCSLFAKTGIEFAYKENERRFA